MDLTRRRLLSGTSAWLLIGGTGLLAACQSATAPSSAPTSAAPPTLAPAAAVAAPTVAPAPLAKPAASPSASAASPSPSPAVAAAAAPSPAPPRPTSVPAAAVAAGKPMYQQDARHTGRSPSAGPRKATSLRRFDASLPANMPADPVTPRSDFQSSSVVGPDGTIYIANFPGVLFALRDNKTAADQLEVAWRFHPANASSFHATPALSADGSTIYLGFAAGGFNGPSQANLYALKTASNGAEPTVTWNVDLGAARVMASPTVGSDGTIYVANSMGVLFAVAANGSVKWTAQTGPTIKSAPAIAVDGTIYHATSDGKMYALTPQGQVKWTFDFGEHLGPTPLMTAQATGPGGGGGGASGIGSGASPTIRSDGTVFIGANNSNMYAVAPDGSMKWLFEAERELAGIWTTPVLSADESTIYFGANKGGIYALNADNGSKRWQFGVYGSIYASSVLDAQGVLYTGTTIEHVYALNSANGEPVWDFDNHNQVWAAPSIRPDSTLVIADRSGLIQVLG